MSIRSIAALTALLSVLGIARAADAKPKIAILGLEVIDDGSMDAETTRAAQLLTEELRKQATRPGGVYELAPNSAKDLLELKLLSNCSDEGRGCMSEIGADLGADVLLYGKLEKRDDGYQVSLRLLNTETEQMQKTTSELIPFADVAPGRAGTWASTLYSRLTGAPQTGTLVIRSNAEKGTVYIDGEVKTSLSDGTAKVLGLSEGTHAVVIDAPGFTRYEADVAIDAGGTEELSVSLLPTAGDLDEDASDGGGWRMAFLGGVLLTGGMTAGWVYNGLRVRGELRDTKDSRFRAIEATDEQSMTYVVGQIAEHSSDVLVHQLNDEGESVGVQRPGQECVDPGTGDFVYGSRDCRVATIGDACEAAKALPPDQVTPEVSSYIDACERGENAALLTNVFIGATVASAVVTAYFGYKGWFAGGRSSREKRDRGSASPTVRIAPTISPQGVGAGLTIEF